MPKKIETSCENCNGNNIKTHATTYPIQMGEKQINVERVWVDECMDCGTMTPTKAGQEKVSRTFFGLLTSPIFR